MDNDDLFNKYLQEVKQQLALAKAAIKAIEEQRYRKKQLNLILDEIAKVDKDLQVRILKKLQELKKNEDPENTAE